MRQYAAGVIWMFECDDLVVGRACESSNWGVIMFRLGFWLMPYALVVGGVVAAVGAGRVLVTGSEKAPTSRHISEITPTSPKAEWVKATGAGFYLAGTIEDVAVHKKTGIRTVTAYYVPILTPTEAAARTRVGGAPIPRQDPTPVLAKLTPEQFDSMFPGHATARNPEWYRPMEVQGTRNRMPTMSRRFGDYVRGNLGVESEAVTVIDYDNKPMDRPGAFRAMVLSIGALIGGLCWMLVRANLGFI